MPAQVSPAKVARLLLVSINLLAQLHHWPTAVTSAETRSNDTTVDFVECNVHSSVPSARAHLCRMSQTNLEGYPTIYVKCYENGSPSAKLCQELIDGHTPCRVYVEVELVTPIRNPMYGALTDCSLDKFVYEIAYKNFRPGPDPKENNLSSTQLDVLTFQNGSIGYEQSGISTEKFKDVIHGTNVVDEIRLINIQSPGLKKVTTRSTRKFTIKGGRFAVFERESLFLENVHRLLIDSVEIGTMEPGSIILHYSDCTIKQQSLIIKRTLNNKHADIPFAIYSDCRDKINLTVDLTDNNFGPVVPRKIIEDLLVIGKNGTLEVALDSIECCNVDNSWFLSLSRGQSSINAACKDVEAFSKDEEASVRELCNRRNALPIYIIIIIAVVALVIVVAVSYVVYRNYGTSSPNMGAVESGASAQSESPTEAVPEIQSDAAGASAVVPMPMSDTSRVEPGPSSKPVTIIDMKKNSPAKGSGSGSRRTKKSGSKKDSKKRSSSKGSRASSKASSGVRSSKVPASGVRSSHVGAGGKRSSTAGGKRSSASGMGSKPSSASRMK